MSNAISETIIERLTYVKALYDISESIAKRGSSVDVSLALVILDNSIENLLWIILNSKRPADMGRAYNSFGDLVNEVNTTLQSLSLSVDTSNE